MYVAVAMTCSAYRVFYKLCADRRVDGIKITYDGAIG